LLLFFWSNGGGENLLYKNYLKRPLDIVISIFVLVFLSPLFAIAAILIFMGDGFPILYQQQRVGRNALKINILKFRTMKQNMEHLGSTSLERDPRYFRGSRFLRVFKIDELPQLFNILRGEMTLVGPRPTVFEDYEKMNNNQKYRFSVTPGLTGLAQISGNTRLKWPERIELDLAYVENLSFFCDFKILLRTAEMWFSNRLDSNPPDSGEW
jgi:undecaprenyl phosphate N,N'-diacetylbacillosamine 1-phosphate transferase